MGKKKKKKQQEEESAPPEPSAPPLDAATAVPGAYVVPVYMSPQPLNIQPYGSYPSTPPTYQAPATPPIVAVVDPEPTEDDVETQKKTEKRRKKKVGQKGRNSCIPKEIKAFIALVTILLAIFDLYADGNAVRVYVNEEMSYLTYAMLVIIFVSSVLFLLQVYAFYLRVRSLCEVRGNKEHNEKDAILLKRENQYLCCAETTGYLLLVLEDLPVSAILVLVTFMPILDFNNGVDYCDLYYELFEKTYAGWLALLSALVAASWKFLLSFFYASACCCMEWGGIEGHCFRGCCCFFRVIRPILALAMVGCAFYIYFFYRQGLLVAQLQCDFDE